MDTQAPVMGRSASQMQSEIDLLRDATEKIAMMPKLFSDRLAQVLKGVPAQLPEGVVEAKVPERILVPHAAEIHKASAKLYLAHVAMLDILNRIEV